MCSKVEGLHPARGKLLLNNVLKKCTLAMFYKHTYFILYIAYANQILKKYIVAFSKITKINKNNFLFKSKFADPAKRNRGVS